MLGRFFEFFSRVCVKINLLWLRHCYGSTILGEKTKQNKKKQKKKKKKKKNTRGHISFWHFPAVYCMQLKLYFLLQLNSHYKNKRASSWEMRRSSICEQQRFRRACACAQSRQNRYCSLTWAEGQGQTSAKELDM